MGLGGTADSHTEDLTNRTDVGCDFMEPEDLEEDFPPKDPPVGGGNLSVQELFKYAELKQTRYQATTLQTLAKLIKNSYNLLPRCYHHHE